MSLQMGTSLLFVTPRTKDVERRPCPTNTHTYTLFSSSFHGRLSPKICFCDPHPTVFFLSFFFFLGYKPASRRNQLSSPAASYTFPRTFPAASTSNFILTLKIYTDTARITKDDQVLLLQGFNDVL